MKKILITLRLAIGIFYSALIVVPFLKLKLWFLKNSTEIWSTVNSIFEILALVMLCGNVLLGNMVNALYYMGVLILYKLQELKKKKTEVDLRIDSEMMIGMLTALVNNNSGYALIKKPDAQFATQENKSETDQPTGAVVPDPAHATDAPTVDLKNEIKKGRTRDEIIAERKAKLSAKPKF